MAFMIKTTRRLKALREAIMADGDKGKLDMYELFADSFEDAGEILADETLSIEEKIAALGDEYRQLSAGFREEVRQIRQAWKEPEKFTGDDDVGGSPV